MLIQEYTRLIYVTLSWPNWLQRWGRFELQNQGQFGGGASRGQISSHLVKSATQLVNQQLPICCIFDSRRDNIAKSRLERSDHMNCKNSSEWSTLGGEKLASEGLKLCKFVLWTNMNKYDKL